MFSSTKLGLVVLAGLLILIAVAILIHPQTKDLVKINQIWGENMQVADLQSAALRKIVQDNLQGQTGEYAVWIEELKGTASAVLNEDLEKYSFNDDDPFPAASLYKLILLSAVYQQIEEGVLKKEEILSATKTHLSEVYGGIDFGYENFGRKIEYPVEEALERVGRISDNFAAILLAEKLRENSDQWQESGVKISSDDPLALMAEKLGLKQTVFGINSQTSASDMAIFLKALSGGQVVSKTSSEEIIKVLGLSQINDRIPALLPEEVRVVHKTGELSGVRHDVGIVYLKDHPYIIVLLSKDLPFEDEGVQTLSNLSKAVFDYFSQKK